MMFLKKFFKKKVKREIAPFYETGFHGDAYLLKFVDSGMKGCEVFIETGANVGSTLAYVARTYPGIECLSCEPDRAAYEEALRNTARYPNVRLYNETSQDFIARLKKDRRDVFGKMALFWLDAHGYGFKWPLKDEIDFVTSNFSSAFIFIDDFKVPGMECFAYDIYQDQTCSLDFVRDSLNRKNGYRVYYPDYTEKTSKHHPLVGWGLIEFGHGKEMTLDEGLRSKIKGPLNV